jgi:hypothetical protein
MHLIMVLNIAILVRRTCHSHRKHDGDAILGVHQ